MSTLKQLSELQQQYTNYKNNLQQLAQRIGDIEQDTEEHKYVLSCYVDRHIPVHYRYGCECEGHAA